MATRKQSRPASNRSRQPAGGGFGTFLLGVLVTIAIVASAAFYFHVHLPAFHPHTAARKAPPAPAVPVASDADDRPKPPPLQAPPATAPHAPFSMSEDVFEAGARLYVKPTGGTSCATCHGTPNRMGAMMESIRPGAAQFFEPRSTSTRSPSQLFLRTKYGVQGAPGMPAYAGTLTDTQIWQLALLLSHAGEPLPDPVTRILNAHK